MQFGANTFIWASPFSTAQHLALVDHVARLGFDVIEVAFEDPALIDLDALAGRAADVGLGVLVCGAYGPGRNLVSADPAERAATAAYVRTLIDAAARLGSPVVGGPAYGAVGKTPAADPAARQRERDLAAAELRPLAAYAGQRGVRLALEPLNRFETDLINVVDQGLALVEAVGSPYLGLHLDTFHMHLEERDSAAAIRRAGDRLFHFHACENDRGTPGRGQVAWAAVAAALADVGYDGPVVIESFTPEVKSIARAVCIWREIAASQDEIAAEGLAFLRELLLRYE
jgi:D-psicose/D-tagatose/L-ribulose 3-epimerase